MATWEDARTAALALPGAQEVVRGDGTSTWQVGGRTFAWERPLRGSDRRALGAAAPQGPILAARVSDLDERAALITQEPSVFFTIPHFAGYPAVLVLLERIDPLDLRDLLTEAWLLRATGEVVETFWAAQRGRAERVDRHVSGSVRARGLMLDGALHGTWEWFRTDGTRLRSGSFDRGEQVGTWTTYDRAGRVHTVTEKGSRP